MDQNTNIPANRLDSNGNLIPVVSWQKIQAEQLADSIAQRLIDDSNAAAKANTPQTESQLKNFRSHLATARAKGDKVMVEMLTAQIAGLVNEQAEADTLVAFDNDELVAPIIATRDALARKGKELFIGANPRDVDLMVALVDRRHQFPSAQSFRDSYDAVRDRVNAANVEHHRKIAADKSLAKDKAAFDAASADVALKEAEMRQAGFDPNKGPANE